MPLGPGKYDDLCTEVREKAQAEGAIVIVISGQYGSGFSCQTEPAIIAGLPDMLETMAKQMRESFAQGQV